MELSFPLKKLLMLHIFIIVISNYAVQIPISLFGFHSTVGTFTFPFVFVTTDLTVRMFGARKARKIIFLAMIPALIISYFVGALFAHGAYQGLGALGNFDLFVFRIAAASFGAYVLGQLSDILVFSRLRQLRQWWPAPASSSVAGTWLDTFAFFFIAFYACSDPFMAEHWVEIAWVDYAVKLAIGLMLFVPIYGIILNYIAKYVLHRPLTGIAMD